jgi:hypothetical protein
VQSEEGYTDRRAIAVIACSRLGEERLEVLAEDSMQHAVLGPSGTHVAAVDLGSRKMEQKG